MVKVISAFVTTLFEVYVSVSPAGVAGGEPTSDKYLQIIRFVLSSARVVLLVESSSIVKVIPVYEYTLYQSAHAESEQFSEL